MRTHAAQNEAMNRELGDAWKRGANLLVWRDPFRPDDGTRIIRRHPGRSTTLFVWSEQIGRHTQSRAHVVDYLWHGAGGMQFEVTHLVLDNAGRPRFRKHGGPPRTWGYHVSINGLIDPSTGEVRWSAQISSEYGPHKKKGGPYGLRRADDEALDLYGTRMDELRELYAQNLPTGAYKVAP